LLAAAALAAGALCAAEPSAATSPASARLVAELPTPPSSATAASAGLALTTLDQIDVRAFAQIVSDATGRRFVVADDVQARFSVVVPGRGPQRVPSGEVFPFFLTVLASAGLTVADEGGVFRIVKLPEGGLGIGGGAEASGLVTRVFRLENVPAEEVRKVLEANGARKGAVGVLDESNQIVVTDARTALDRIARLVSELDQPGAARVTEVVALQFADADGLAQQLNMAIAESESRASQLLGRLPAPPGGSAASAAGAGGAVVVPSPHANSLILVGARRQIDNLRSLIARLDVETPSGRGRLNAIFVHYVDAAQAAKSISALLEKSAAKSPDGKSVRRISVEASLPNNALLVDASPSDFEVVSQLVAQLDRPPGQVHIAVQIVEMADGNSLTLGTQMSLLTAPSKKGETTVSGATRFSADSGDGLLAAVEKGIFPQGLSVGVARGVGIDEAGNLQIGYGGVNINAIRQSDRVDILSETTLQSQDNQEASVSIVNDIPILKSTIQGGSGTSRDVIQNIDRLEVGVKLKLTPHLAPDGLVRMELSPSIEAVIDSGSSAADAQYTPTIARRTASTTVTVPDGQTIVIAGLTRKDRQKVDRRIPLLGDIPVLGWLFRYRVASDRRTNLLILVTPTRIPAPSDAADVRRAWERKTGLPSDESSPAQRP
jgi:general secretion pathway protein D